MGIDAMSVERLTAMRRAGFRVLGFGIESFSQKVLGEFNKAQIYRHIEPMLSAALALGVTPFLDLILSSPRASLEDVAETLREAYVWLLRGCEIGMYPYVIPFSGAALAKDPSLAPHVQYVKREIAGTGISWSQPAKILPIDPVVADVVLRIERSFELMLATNHLGPFLLTNLLRDRLAGAGRVINVTAPSSTRVDVDQLMSKDRFRALRTFGATKAASLMFTFELARRGKRWDVRAYAYHPGLVRSELMREASRPIPAGRGIAVGPRAPLDPWERPLGWRAD